MSAAGTPAGAIYPVRIELVRLPAVENGDQRRRKWYADRADESTWQPVPHFVEQEHHAVVRSALWALLQDREATMALADNRQVIAHAHVPGLGLVSAFFAVPMITTIREDALRGAA